LTHVWLRLRLSGRSFPLFLTPLPFLSFFFLSFIIFSPSSYLPSVMNPHTHMTNGPHKPSNASQESSPNATFQLLSHTLQTCLGISDKNSHGNPLLLCPMLSPFSLSLSLSLSLYIYIYKRTLLPQNFKQGVENPG
jgi:hypothetical protein